MSTSFSLLLSPQIVASFTAREQSAYAAAGAVAEEVLSAIRTVVAFGGENKEAERSLLPPLSRLPTHSLDLSPPPLRYGTHLKKARSEGVKKSMFTGAAVGALYFIMFNTFALGFWSVTCTLVWPLL